LNAQRGRRSWLAREIKVPPQLVTDWFAKRKTPTWEQGSRITVLPAGPSQKLVGVGVLIRPNSRRPEQALAMAELRVKRKGPKASHPRKKEAGHQNDLFW